MIILEICCPWVYFIFYKYEMEHTVNIIRKEEIYEIKQIEYKKDKFK